MSLVIRLTKTGRKGEAKFRVVVMEKRSRRDGRPVESLGSYEKKEQGENIKIDKERISYWLAKGAKASQTVSKLLTA
ncbi:MAG: 30S ribosomal protein S16 [bacterium]|nr:30S ribosomal protein S16 [bacterium]